MAAAMPQPYLDRWFLFMILAILCIFAITDGSRILVYPNDLQNNAQFKSLVMVAETLAEKHEVTLLVNSLVEWSPQAKYLTVVRYALPSSVALPEAGKNFLQPEMRSSLFSLVGTDHLQAMLDTCEALLKRQYLMIQLQLQEFDIIFADITNICARVLIDYLHIPTITWCFDNYDISCDFSNDLMAMAGSQDVIARIKHSFKYMIHTQLYQSSFIFRPFDELQHRYNYNRKLSISETYSRNKPLVILNADFSVDMPRPLMPFVIPIAGLTFHRNGDLPHDIQNFIANSGLEGFIFVELALKESLFFQKQLHKILDALKKSERYVIIEDGIYAGANFQGKLKTISSEFHGAIVSQKELSLFITGCSANTVHDTIYHNLPVIYLSSFGDTDYCRTVFQRHKIGKVLNVFELSSIDIEEKINSLADIVRFEKNMEKLSKVFKHRVNNSKERLWHWVDFVTINKGADSLYNNASQQLRWYQYGMLDLVFLVLFGTILSLFVFLKLTLYIIRQLIRRFLWIRQAKYKLN